MNGHLDVNNRAMLPIAVRPKLKDDATTIEAWVDTAFDGHFVFSATLIEEFGLETLVETEAILADGSMVTLKTCLPGLVRGADSRAGRRE